MKEFGGVEWDEKSASHFVKIRGTCDSAEDLQKLFDKLKTPDLPGLIQAICDGVESGVTPLCWSGRIYLKKEEDFELIRKKLESWGWIFNADVK